jgi:hypothetical protein
LLAISFKSLRRHTIKTRKIGYKANSIQIGLFLASLLINVIVIPPVVSNAETLRFIDIVEITWSGAASTKVNVLDVERVVNGPVIEYWSGMKSYQDSKMKRSINFALGKTGISRITLQSQVPCGDEKFVDYLLEVRKKAYLQFDISNFANRYLIILTPNAGCIWSGRALLGNMDSSGGLIAIQDNASAFVITHELGHTLGLGHSNLIKCSPGFSDGAWGKDCRAVEYGGSIDVMGNVETTSQLSTYHQWRIGLLEAREIHQSWLNESIDLSASDMDVGTRAVFIRDGKTTYWIEYRRPKAGLSYNPGLVIYRTDPPSPSFIDSPNPDDRIGFEPGLGVSTDIWMLNLDTYSYSATGRASGSMTLAQGRSTTLYSGAITIEALATSSDQKITVKVSRKADTNPPPTPPVTPIDTWRYPGAEIIQSGYDDLESVIASFEAQIDEKIVPIDSSLNTNFVPTYLDPFISRRAVYVKDLPEGSYSLSLRAIDIWGNKSSWSPPRKVTIDRGRPIVKSDLSVLSATQGSLQISLKSISDSGSGLCATQIVNEEGFVTQSSAKKSGPEFKFARSTDLKAQLHTYDCLGNGVISDLSLKSSYIPGSKSSKTGKWSNSSLLDGAITCTGRCSASFTTSGKAYLLVAEGAPNVLLSSKVVAKVEASSIKAIRTGALIDIGPRNRVLRVSGSNFTLIGIARVDLALSNQREMARLPSASDSSLSEPIQKGMARYGFVSDDFASGWIVLPMARGTTLDDPTLDLCSATFKSESGRQYRRQVSASKVGSPYLFLSSEVVKYKDRSAADAALTELISNYQACVKNKGGVERDGTFVDYTFTPMPQSNLELVPESSRVLVRAQIGKGVSARQLLAFYQFKGEIFTGLYVVKAGEVGFDDAEVKRWFEAASLMATRLETKY